MSSAPVIIEAAINGATSKDRNPNVPRSPEEIAADILASIDAGAAIIHNHIDLRGTSGEEAAARYLEAWRPVLEARPDALVYPTVNFGADGHNYDHIAPLAASGLLRMGLCDPGSMNMGRSHDGVPSGGMVYSNSFDDITYQLELMNEHELGASLAIYEPGFLRCALAWQRAGRLPRGSLAKLYFSTELGLGGIVFGLPPTEKALDAYLELLDGSGLEWAVSVSGGDLVDSGMADLGLARGGHLHLGLEFYGGDRTPTNVELIDAAVARCEAHGRPVATPDEAAAILGVRPRT
jgi:3-keto-5-aminohexanoate cleavage enzyme